MNQSFSKKNIVRIAAVIVVILTIAWLSVYVLNKKQKLTVELPGAATIPLTLKYKSQTINLPSGESFALHLAEGFFVAIAESGLGRDRFMVKSPDGRLFVTDMKDLSDNSEGTIYILDHFNATTKQFESRSTYLSGLRNPNSLAFYTDKNGTQWLYIALTDKLVRYQYTSGEMAPTSLPQILATYPDYGLSYKYGGWHLTRTIKIHNDKVYVSVGSSCDSCEEKPTEKIRATISQMNPDGTDQTIIATGLRNAVGLYFKDDNLYASDMGSDKLGNDRPEETLYKIQPGSNYGWPYCYQYQGKVYQNMAQMWQHPIDCSTVPLAFATFPAHGAPLGLAFFDNNSAPELANSFLLSLHGSSDISLQRGDKIVRIDQNGHVLDFITGFLQGTTRYGRPVDIMPDSPSSFFFTDDFNGNLYYVYK